jgi:3-dehydroquinate synthase II|tara:strand:+ start:1449 stop:2546 length:1098 start_codon:yes stop_codon:yes gene_type:complete
MSTWKKRKSYVTSALEAGASIIIVRDTDISRVRKLGNLKIATFNGGGDVAIIGLNSEGDGTINLPNKLEDSVDLKRINELKRANKEVAGYVEINGKEFERLAAIEAKDADYVVVVGKDWTIIPLENLIAELQKDKGKVIAKVTNVEDARLAVETLEVGVDGVLIETNDIRQIKKISEIIQKEMENLSLKVGNISKIKKVGMGDRVCVDTASLLEMGEGMLLGSQANGLFLIHSETLESDYVASRPFRVNAGAVHSYILSPDGKTRYLSEVSAGDEVMAINANGKTRSVIVGRVKIEKRPLLLVEAECNGILYKTLLQNAETINLVSKDGKPISMSQLKVGDKILIYENIIGRHFGMEVEENIIEK